MKKCKQGYYYCYTDKKCKRIPLGYRVASSGYLRKENGEESGEDGENDSTNSNGNGNGSNGSGSGNGGSNGGGMSESKSGDSSLRDWFGKSRSSDGKPGWVQLGGKYAGKPCAKQPGQTTKPKCGSSKMAANLDDKEEKKAFSRKQRQDPNPDRKGKAINVKTEETVVEKAGEKDACYKKVKSRYSVWPSAYASGALVKCRKVGAANWGNKSEELIANTAAEYFFNEGINEYGLLIFIEELGVENFVGFIHDLIEDSELTEAYALTDKKKTPKRLPKGTQPAKTTKATIARGDSKITAASPSGAFKKRPAAAKAVETAKENQPKKKPVKSTLAKSVADTLARGALSAWKGHQTAMKKKKEGASVAKQVGAGLGAAAGAMLKKGKKHLSDDYQYSDWRDDFKAMEYEFIDLIKPEPLVSEGAMPDAIDPKKHKVAQKKTKIRNMTQSPNKNEAEVARKMSKGPSLPMEEVDTRRAPAELVARMSARREGEMAQDGPNKPAYDAKQRILAKTKAKKVETVDEGQKCWKGYEKKGTKKMFGKTYNNCVKKEEKEESRVGGGNLKKLAIQATKRIDADVDGDVDSVDMKSPETGVFVPSPDGKKKLKPKVRFEGASDWKSELGEGAAWTKKSGKSKSGGLNEKGRKSYERENPGSDLKAPSKKVGNPRRKSFCARMKGMRKRQKPSNNTGDDRLSKSLRAWNC